jgi:hypothetical protein
LEGRSVAWASGDDAIATISESGLVTAIGTGEAQVSATSEGKTGRTVVTVSVEVAEVALRIRSPDIILGPIEEITYCYYFRTGNAAAIAIKQWRSRLSVGVHDMALAFTTSDQATPGSQSAAGCTYFGPNATNSGAIVYMAHQPEAGFDFPVDDGTGMPVGQRVRADQAGYLRIHFINPTSEPLAAHVEVDGIAYAPGTAVTLADSYVSYDGAIEIASLTSKSESQACPTPADALFIRMSTHAHKQAAGTSIEDQAAVLFQSSDPANPGARIWAAPPFQSIAGGMLTIQCDFVNTTTRIIRSGDSPATDEVCMAVMLYFPSVGAKLCYGIAQGSGVFDVNREPEP